jgi:hypothetical protein
MREATTRDRVRLWATAALLPAVLNAAAIYVNLGPGWTSFSASEWRAFAADALLYVSAVLVIAAPLAGVVAVKIERRAARHADSTNIAVLTTRTLALTAIFFTATSACLTGLEWGGSEGTLAFVATSHATLAAVALALGAFGAYCGAVWRDTLDAAAISLVVSLVAAGGLLVAGASVADASPRALQAGLMASPFVAAASAAQIDVVRLETFYQISPLAHMRVDYPTWQAACGWYLAVGCVCFVGVTLRFRNGRPA